jgi:hypothetical protein
LDDERRVKEVWEADFENEHTGLALKKWRAVAIIS